MEKGKFVRATFKARPRRSVTISDVIEEISAKFSMSLSYLGEVEKEDENKATPCDQKRPKSQPAE